VRSNKGLVNIRKLAKQLVCGCHTLHLHHRHVDLTLQQPLVDHQDTNQLPSRAAAAAAAEYKEWLMLPCA
jgi:hypothetical protein